jgi:hypothetical protein
MSEACAGPRGGVFNGDCKERLTRCRHCDAPRPHEKETRAFVTWMRGYTGEPDCRGDAVHPMRMPWPANVLQRAVAEDLIEGVEDGWRLTPRGRAFAETIEREDWRP